MIRGFTIVWLETPLAVIYIVPATAVPVEGIAALGGVVTYNKFPVGVAKMVATGEAALPIVPRLASDSVQPLPLFPPVIYALDPLIYIPFASAGVPLVIRSRLLLTYPPAIDTLAPPMKPVKVAVEVMVAPVISMFVGFVIIASNWTAFPILASNTAEFAPLRLNQGKLNLKVLLPYA